jgi:type I restriction enzyme S subunit
MVYRMTEWIECTLDKLGEIVGGATPSTKCEDYYGGSIPWITPKDLSSFKGRYITSGERNITEKGLASCSAQMMPKDAVLFTSRAPIGYVAIASQSVCTNQGFKSIVVNEKADPLFVYYLLKYNKDAIEAMGSGTTFKEVSGKTMRAVKVRIPLDVSYQKRIAAVLDSLDTKIENNERINDNLEQQAMALYRQMFVENNNDARRECRADECFDISIGKTPPRKEAQWFSMNPTDCIWVSISDMGRCGMYIADSSEYLTHESVDKFNIKVVPDNTVLLSFKLTVGRVAITDGAMVTNEAIAHFKTDKPEINEYLYCYLKDFNYQTMGSTSSIATAVNSKIIKAMPFVVPTDAELVSFHSATAPMFEMIKTRQRENTRLAELRDSLLPKLMSGEIDVSAVQL